ncbi:MAG: SPOR domain-containing protein [Celeribacter marinus]
MTQDFKSHQGTHSAQIDGYAAQPNYGHVPPQHGQPQHGGQPHAQYGASRDPSGVHSEQQYAPQPAYHAPRLHAQHHGQYGSQFGAPEAGYADYDDGAVAQMPRLGVTQWAGAAVSLVLVLSIGVWGYKQMVRDVSGVPVIRALAGEARSIPDDPGGQLAMHQGLAVNSVTADGSAAAPADRLMLAPKPIALLDEDQPMGEIEPEATFVAYAPDTNAYAIEADDGLTQIAVVPDALELTDFEQVSAPLASGVDLGPDVSVSPMPKPRPVRLAAAHAANATATDALPSLDGVAGDILAAVGATDEVDMASLSADTAIVQLGAFPKRESALIEWDRLSAKFSDFMDGKQRVVVEATSGGKPFYRLRAVGFANTDDSKRFCAALNAMNAACVPVARN